MGITKYECGYATLWHTSCSDLGDVYSKEHFSLMLFSTPYPETRGFNVPVSQYLTGWLPWKLFFLTPLLTENGVIMQNVWFPRTAEGWYDERIFKIPRIYQAFGLRMIDPHPWDKINAPPSGKHTRHDHNEFEFCFTFAKGKDYTYHKYRSPYAPKTKAKAASGNMRQPDIDGRHAGGHSDLHPEGAAQGNIYRFSPTGGQERYRPRIKDGVFPMALAKRAILQYSNPEEVVLDPFCGSGTTLVEAVENNRFAVGCDTNIDNINVAKEWLLEVQNLERSKES